MFSLQTVRESSVIRCLKRLPVFVVVLGAVPGWSLAAPSIDFLRDVAPILEEHCVKCHKSVDPNGDLDLTRAATVLGTPDNGGVVVAGKPGQSALLEMISGPEPQMPKEGRPLAPEQIATLRGWIEQGASWPAGAELADKNVADTNWWSLQPLQLPEMPQLNEGDAKRVRTPVDVFILAKVREQGLSPSAEADRRTLIRRLYFDLVGLPPTPEETESFATDASPKAYEQLVEMLLSSQRYGERWARHWLDLVHYADTHGFDKDKVRNHAWPYRDYVIRAFNEDKPYDRFVFEQLAGDVIYPGEKDGIVALGFLATGPFDWVGQIEVAEGTTEKKRVRNLDRDDMVRNAIETFCSATIGCARCHDHKFDPFTTQDYYALQAVFAAVDRADRLYESDPGVEQQRQSLVKKRQKLTAQISDSKKSQQKQTSRADKQRLEDVNKALEVINSKLTALPEQKLVFAATTAFEKQGQFQPTLGTPRPVYLLMRGSVSSPIQQVKPGTIRCLPQLSSHFDSLKQPSEGSNRAALAEWILDEQNPLTWRSIVNRVWQYHFGRGLVDTASDFGRMGSESTHPKLLDWLATEFRDGDRSLKELHRLIVNSATYRQSSQNHHAYAKIDDGNRYVWRMNRRRLDAESIRDTVLFVSGKLDTSMYGPGFRAFGFEDDHSPRYKYATYDPDEPTSHRRSIYRFIVRSVPDPWMDTLDCADPSALVAKRNETITPLQSLALMNNPFVVRMAEHMAERVRTSSEGVANQVSLAMQLALGRLPMPSEAKLLTAIADKHGMPNACRTILNMNEFIFVD